MQAYKVVTVSHKTTGINQLKDYLLTADDTADYPINRLEELKESFRISELMYLNTCNRVTFFFTCDYDIDHDFVRKLFLFINPGLKEQIIAKHKDVSQIYQGSEALEHIFRVAASLDSLIVGEREILGQLKDAYNKAKDYGLSGDKIRLAMEKCVVLAKRVYHQTRIGEKPVSVVSIAFRRFLALELPTDTPIVKIGAGQTNGVLSNLLKKYGYTDVSIFNRTIDKAAALAKKFNGEAYTLSELPAYKKPFKVIMSCTASDGHVLTLADFERMNVSKEEEYIIIDLAVPADIDPQILYQYKVQYIDVASLEKEAAKNMEFRKNEMKIAERILTEFILEFDDSFKRRQLEIALSELPTAVKAIKSKALEEVFKKELDTIGEEERAIIAKMMDYFEKKYIALPMKVAKRTLLDDSNFRD